MKIIDGDLLQAEVSAICHQCNVKSPNVGGLAALIFRKHPEAHTKQYFMDNTTPILGSIDLFKVNGAPYKGVINMYAQRFPGHGSVQDKDSKQFREQWFKQCLEKIKNLKLRSVAFPYMIGCDLAGGDWNTYEKMIEKYDEQSLGETYIIRLVK